MNAQCNAITLSTRENRYLCKRRHIGDTTLRAFNIDNFSTARGLLLLSFKSVCKIIKKHEKYKEINTNVVFNFKQMSRENMV